MINPALQPSVNPLSQHIMDNQIIAMLNDKGIKSLNPIQIEAVEAGLFFHKNLLVCTPSGSGKTLVGEMAIANTLLKGLGKAIYMAPYKALSHEKGDRFAEEYRNHGLTVQTITSDTDDEDMKDLADTHLLIATYEKCDLLMRQNSIFLEQVKCIVIDEIHEIATSMRGGRLELLITRLLSSLPFVQIIALSATIHNYHEFRNWLSSFGHKFGLIQSDKRPVPLQYKIVLEPNKAKAIKEELDLVLKENGQAIIFVNRRADCPRFAKQFAGMVKKTLNKDDQGELIRAKNELRLAHSIAVDLLEVLDFGIAYHNASLGARDRKVVEKLYHDKVLKVLVATSTLAAGINLPARVVIVANVMQVYHNEAKSDTEIEDEKHVLTESGEGFYCPLSKNQFFQMLGRAGRPGYDPTGIGITIAKDMKELEFIRTHYFLPETDSEGHLLPRYADLESQLNNPRTLQESMLVLIGANQVTTNPSSLPLSGCSSISSALSLTKDDLTTFLHRTYFAHRLKGSAEKNLKISSTPGDGLKNILQFLLIQKMDLTYFLQLHGNFDIPLKDPALKYTKVTGDLVEAQLTVNHDKLYHLKIGRREGFVCSCWALTNDKINRLGLGFQTQTYSMRLCAHLSYLLQECTHCPDQVATRTIKYLLPILTNHEYVLDYLQANGFIATTYNPSLRKNFYSISNFGKLTLGLYFYPDDMVWIRETIENHAFTHPHIVYDKAVEFLARSNQKPVEDLKHVMELWVEEHTMDDILSQFPQYGLQDIFMFRGDIARILHAFQAIATYLSRSELIEPFKIAETRITYGIKADLIPIMEYYQPNITRNKARILYNSGYTSIDKIAQTNPIEIFKDTQIPLEKVVELQERQPKKAVTLLDFM